MRVTKATAYWCSNDERLAAVRGRSDLNGIEAIELVVPQGELIELPTELEVLFVNPVAVVPPAHMFRIGGGSANQGLTVTTAHPTHDLRTVRLVLETAGDLTDYELRIVDPGTVEQPPPGIDPILARAVFSFGVVCEADVDCLDVHECPPVPLDDPRIDRLARDYPGFRRLLLDQLAVVLPDWQRRNPADVRVALVELLAYLGDQLSYEQDAVATEAYLGTARQRISVRRHARLVDYFMHDGLSARSFIQLTIGAVADVASGRTEAAAGTFITAAVDQTEPLDATSTDGARELTERRRHGEQVFHILTTDEGAGPLAAVAPQVFSEDHNLMSFYTWTGTACCLPVGATSATLAGTFPELAAGDVLILAEQRNPVTGETIDADPTHRHAVRLTSVIAGSEASPLTDPATADPVTEIDWMAADALPFAMTVSTEATDELEAFDDVTVALGNIVLAEHGATIVGEHEPGFVGLAGANEAAQVLTVPVSDRPWQPVLDVRDLSQSAPLPTAESSAREMTDTAVDSTTPNVEVQVGDNTWLPTRDLIGVAEQRLVVAEIDNNGRTHLRFGVAEEGDDDTLVFAHGQPPDPGAGGEIALVRARSGVGPVGNVGAGAIRRRVITGLTSGDLGPALSADGVVVAVSNPLPAWGGTAPETIEHVRQTAPFAFNVQERAVTAADYARRAEQFFDVDLGGVQQAVAQLRWTGSWYTVFVAVDRVGGAFVDPEFEAALAAYLDRYRMAGHDVEIEGAVDVPLEVALEVTLDASTLRTVAMKTLTDVLSNRRLADGRLGLFHPDRLTLAQTVYLSPILAEAQGVAGVVGVRATRFGPYRRPTVEAKDVGYLEVGRNEIARLDNDPSRPDRGVLGITLIGGR